MRTSFRRLPTSSHRPLRVEALENREVPATIVVTDLGDVVGVDGRVTLREAVQSVNAAAPVNADVSAVGSFGTDDRVTFAAGLAGTITVSGSAINVLAPVAIVGPGAGAIAITTPAGSPTNSLISVGLFAQFTGGTVRFSGLTFTGGRATGAGGAIRSSNASLAVSDCVFTDNQANNFGGAISLNRFDLTVIDCVFRNNASLIDDGGAIGAVGGRVSVSGSTFEGNAAGPTNRNGGAVFVGGGELDIDRSRFTNNSAPNGGAVFGAGVVRVSSTVVTGNTASGAGGGVAVGPGSTLTLTDSTVSGNQARNGGGVYATGGSTGIVRGSTISGNTATGVAGPFGTRQGGGGLWLDGNGFRIENTTISGNSASIASPYATSYGGGGVSVSGSVTFVNATLVGNSIGGGLGGGVFVRNQPIGSTGLVTLQNTIVANSTGGTDVARRVAPPLGATFPPEGRIDAAFSLIQNPGTDLNGAVTDTRLGLDPRLGPLADNGGPTLTHALLPGSPAIGAGSSALAAGSATDQRGAGFPRGIGRVDIGAFEAPSPLTSAASPEAVAVGPGAGVGADAGRAVLLGPDGSVRVSVEAFPGFPGGVRVATGDVTGDGVPDLLAGAGPGGSPRVALFDGATGRLLLSFDAFEASHTGGVFVAVGDVTGDGFADVVVTPDTGGGPVVAVFDGRAAAAGNLVERARFFGIQDPAFAGGARVAVGDINGDGLADVVVSAGVGGGPRVSVWDGGAVLAGRTTLADAPAADFFAFESTLRNGCFVAVGDVTGDGFADVIFGGGPGGGPRVRIADGLALLRAGTFGALDSRLDLQVASFFAGDPRTTDGVPVAAADVDGDANADVLAGSGENSAPVVRVYSGRSVASGGTPSLVRELDPLPGFTGGVFVG